MVVVYATLQWHEIKDGDEVAAPFVQGTGLPYLGKAIRDRCRDLKPILNAMGSLDDTPVFKSRTPENHRF